MSDNHGIPAGAEAFLVGGAVRDELLGAPGKDRDWVVVGTTPAAMLGAGFSQVGRDFPVFLHPVTHEEYALARTERKTGPGHTGFSANINNVTLPDDLARRDLTINAIAKAADGSYVDPHGGRKDLAARKLRHVSVAFAEDPLRVLRLARFAARLAAFGFTVAEETLALCRTMTGRGALGELAAERVWDEFWRALDCDQPMRFFDVMQDVDALERISPLLTSTHLDSLRALLPALHSQDARAVYLFSRLDAEATFSTLEALRAPGSLRDLAVLVAMHYPVWANVLQLSAEDTEALLAATDAYRRQERFATFCWHCSLHDEGGEAIRQAWTERLSAALTVDTRQIATGLEGRQIGAAIRSARIDKLKT